MCGLSVAETMGQGKQAIPKAERGKFRGSSGHFAGSRRDGDGRDGARAATLVPCSSETMRLESEVLKDLAEAAANTGAWDRDFLVHWIRTGAVACEAAGPDPGRARATRWPSCCVLAYWSRPPSLERSRDGRFASVRTFQRLIVSSNHKCILNLFLLQDGNKLAVQVATIGTISGHVSYMKQRWQARDVQALWAHFPTLSCCLLSSPSAPLSIATTIAVRCRLNYFSGSDRMRPIHHQRDPQCHRCFVHDM
jgi:hypothetical protein